MSSPSGLQVGIAEPVDRAEERARVAPHPARRSSRSQPTCCSRRVAPVSAISPATGTTAEASSRTRRSAA